MLRIIRKKPAQLTQAISAPEAELEPQSQIEGATTEPPAEAPQMEGAPPDPAATSTEPQPATAPDSDQNQIPQPSASEVQPEADSGQSAPPPPGGETPSSDETQISDDRPGGRKVVCETSNPGPVANDTGYTFTSPKTGDVVRVLHRDDESREDAIARVRKAHGL